MIVSVTLPSCTIPVAIVAATFTDSSAPTKFRIDASSTAERGCSARVEIDRCHDVGGVVEAVGEVERESRDDDDHQEQFAVHVPSAPASQPARP